jgi:RHS repeat-associated protein
MSRGDATFAAPNMPLTTNYTAIASDSYGRHSTNTVSVNIATNTTYQYDGNGNLTNDGLRSFAYDDENQLIQVWVNNQWLSQFAYDGKMRRRIRQECAWQGGVWVRTNQVYYVYDGNLVIQERNTNNNVLVTYTRGLDLSGSLQGAGGIGGMLARTDTNGPTYYHADGSGNITALIDGNGNIAARYEYDPYGRLIGRWGALADINRYRFSSKEIHPLSGLYCYGFRFYDPNLSRWLNHDPIGEAGGINLYGFVGNCPIGLIDYYGLVGFWGTVFGTVGGIAGGVVAGGLSLVADTGTVGVNVAATPTEIAGGVAVGTAAGMWFGSLFDSSSPSTSTSTPAAPLPPEAITLPSTPLPTSTVTTPSTPLPTSTVTTPCPPLPTETISPPNTLLPTSTVTTPTPDLPTEINTELPFVPEEYWIGLTDPAPVQSNPFNVIPKYDDQGQLRGATTYDEFGNRAYQYEFGSSVRHGEGYHVYDNSTTGSFGNGPRSPHINY